ncbi:MAG: hypothetical protein KI785_07965 [Devosiaceae bacterium]|nr:hypothetical protein [Devosiaceae bacterium MH13]
MSPSTFRNTMRTAHIVVGAYFYAPPLDGNEAYAALLKFGVLPATVLTGLAMWQMKRLKGLFFS